MPFPTHDRLLDDNTIRSALLELREAGDSKLYVRCRFGYRILYQLLEGGYATIDDVSASTAMVRLTVKGGIAVLTCLG